MARKKATAVRSQEWVVVAPPEIREVPLEIREGWIDPLTVPKVILAVSGDNLTDAAADEAATAFGYMTHVSPNAEFDLRVFGYEEDENPLWEFEELRLHLGTMARLMGFLDIHPTAHLRLSTRTAVLLAMCAGFHSEMQARPELEWEVIARDRLGQLWGAGAPGLLH